MLCDCTLIEKKMKTKTKKGHAQVLKVAYDFKFFSTKSCLTIAS